MRYQAAFICVSVALLAGFALSTPSQTSPGDTTKATRICLGGIFFEGPIAGRTPDGEPSVARMKTAHATVEVQLSGLTTANDVATALLHALEAKGVRCAKGNANEIIVLLEDLDTPIGGQSTDDTLDSGMWKTRL
jgi:hypothetical protein